MSVMPIKNWPPEKILRLIDLYREHPILWDPNHKDFKNSEAKSLVWLNIAETIGSRDAEKKMNILIVQFRRELKKIRERLQAGKTEEEAATKWFAFEAMSFLKGKIKKQKQNAIITPSSNLINESSQYYDQQNELRINKWRPSSSSVSGNIENVEYDQGLVMKSSHDLQKDEYSAFGEMVAIKLRKLTSSYAKNKAMNLITNSLFQVEIECAEDICEETEMVYVKTLEEERCFRKARIVQQRISMNAEESTENIDDISSRENDQNSPGESRSFNLVSKLASSRLMKRTSTRRIIERYIYMLTEGCGSSSCDNENCVSSGKIKPLSQDKAAASALRLLRCQAKICESSRGSKIPRTQSSTSPFQTSETDSASENNGMEDNSSELKFLTENVVRGIVSTCQNASRYSQLVRTLLEVFSKPDTLSKSFLKVEHPFRLSSFSGSDLVGFDKEKLRELEGETEKDVDSSQSMESTFDWTSDETRIDFFALRKAYQNVFELPSHVFEGSLIRALMLLAENSEMELKVELKDKLDNPEEVEKYVISFLIVFEMPTLESGEYVEKALPLLCKAMSYLPYSALARICRVWARYCRNSFKNILDLLHQLIIARVIENCEGKLHLQDNVDIVSATKVMKVLYYANALAGKMESRANTKDEDYDNPEADSNYSLFPDTEMRYSICPSSLLSEDPLAAELKIDLMDCIKPYLPFSDFYNEPLSDAIEMDKDYTNYKSAIRIESSGTSSSRGDGKLVSEKYFSFITYPFVLTPATKTVALFYDNRIRMYSERRNSVLHAISGLPPNPYLKLQVRRDHLIEDALMRLELLCYESPQDFKKQLMVEFEGEQGMDEGGISKEFFQLIVEEIFNPDYGMFTFDQELQTGWFNSMSFENESQYTLIGLIIGLAIYNNIILDVRFPMVVYKKLLGKKGTFNDLEDYSPVLYKSLKCMLEHEDDDLEDVYLQTFRISYKDPFGSVVYHDLIPDGDKVPVTLYNRQQFVDLYADFLLNKSIAKQFNAFRKGFRVVTDESPLKFLFRFEEIEILVCGSKDFNLVELQESTRYDGGYDSSSTIVQYFWELTHSLSHANQRKLLQFTTGSDRVPVGGLGQLHMIIARNGPDSDRLPTAHTCFNILLLPEYSSKEKLCDRLMKAINYSKGFGML